MQKFDVDVTHTTVHRLTVRAGSEAEARARAIEAVKDEGLLSDDITIPVEVRNTYDAATVK